MRFLLYVAVCSSILSAGAAKADDATLRQRATEGMRKACDYFQNDVSCEGGYLWRYSEDLKKREGEGKATATMVWVQPPGTPSVGMALLNAYEATKDPYYLEAARRAGHCLVRGQLRSGGWAYRIEFDPKLRGKVDYRVEPSAQGKARHNVTTLDDDTTQAAMRLLMKLDQTLEFKDEQIHQAVLYGLDHLVQAQYPNGAWPQRFSAPPDPAKYPVKKASYPDKWSRTFPHIDYMGFYTFNDGAIGDVIDVMFMASHIYKDPRYRESALRGGQFILLAQMPDPQPAWAQQYDVDMHPVWARKFEPPAITGGESQGVMRMLMAVYRETGDKKFLEPIPRAIAYLRQSALPDGKLARFYELRTNRPLYFTKDYQLTYSDADMPTHYSFKVGHSLDATERDYQRLAQSDHHASSERKDVQPRKASPALVAQVEKVLAAFDQRGRWVDDDGLRYQDKGDTTNRVISCSTFIRNIRILSQYLATKPD